MSAVDEVERLLALCDEGRDGDDAIERAGRACGEVDRAVRRYRESDLIPVHVTLELAGELGWPICACGAGGVRPGAVVTFRGRDWHVECAAAVIASEAAA